MSDTPKMPYTCASCRWHVPGRKLTTNQQLPGQCRRNPPTFTPAGSRWPAAEAGDWCGEHSRLHEETRVRETHELVTPNRTLTEIAGAAPAGQLAEEAGAAVLVTGGAETDGVHSKMLTPAEAEPPRLVKPAAFERPARRR